jgi:hypothetical protein
MLLADTGAGGLYAPFELILRVSDCQRYMGLRSSDDVALGGAIIGTYPIYAVRVEIPALSVARRVRAVAVSDTACPAGSARSPMATLVTDVSLGWRVRDRNRGA